jgi:hypothetical protein
MAIPTVKEWTTSKTKYGAPDTAGGVTVSKAFTAYWNSGANTPKKYLVAYTALEKALATYIGKVDKKKIKQYPDFEKEFLNGFIGKVHKERVDTERGMATLNTYKAEIVKYMAMVQKLDRKKAKAVDLERFKQGPVRGLSAMASRATGLTTEQAKVLADINLELKKIDYMVDHMGANPTQTQLNSWVLDIIKNADEIAKLAKAGGIA